jgi:hypothetical protein
LPSTFGAESWREAETKNTILFLSLNFMLWRLEIQNEAKEKKCF